MGILVVTEQRMPDAAEGAVRIFDGGSITIANSLADVTGLASTADGAVGGFSAA
jgi:hypothetical protein